jgi:predicted transcriptional regulator
METKSQTTEPVRAPQRIRPVPAVSRSIAILRLLGKTKEPMNVKSIAQALDLVPSTCLHILRVLVAEKLLSFDSASKRYRLGTGMLVLARRWCSLRWIRFPSNGVSQQSGSRWSISDKWW